MKLRNTLVLILGMLLLACETELVDDPRAELRVYNWSDYIAPDTIARFEQETGIEVTYDVFDSNEVLEAKLLSGASGYDIVVPTSNFIGRQIMAGVFQPLDRSKLSNLKNLDPELLELVTEFDPGNRHSVPYLWGTTGVGYNLDVLIRVLPPGTPLDSLDLVFKPEFLSKLAPCGVAFLDAPGEVFQMALNYLGLDPNSSIPGDYENQARELLDSVRPHITYFHSSQYINDLANGDICIALGWSGDVLQAASRAVEAENGIKINYIIPREGSVVWFDLLAIPAGARNTDNAHRFIDFLMRPEIIADISTHVSYANANRESTKLMPAKIVADPGIYPPADIRATLFVDEPLPPKIVRLINRQWTAIKTGR